MYVCVYMVYTYVCVCRCNGQNLNLQLENHLTTEQRRKLPGNGVTIVAFQRAWSGTRPENSFPFKIGHLKNRYNFLSKCAIKIYAFPILTGAPYFETGNKKFASCIKIFPLLLIDIRIIFKIGYNLYFYGNCFRKQAKVKRANIVVTVTFVNGSTNGLRTLKFYYV